MQNLFYNNKEMPKGSYSDRFNQSSNEIMEDQDSQSMNQNEWQGTSRSTDQPRNDRSNRYVFKQKPHEMSKFSNVKQNKDMMDVDS